MVWTIRSCVMADLFQFEPHGLVLQGVVFDSPIQRESSRVAPMYGDTTTRVSNPWLVAGNVVPSAARRVRGDIDYSRRTHMQATKKRQRCYKDNATHHMRGRWNEDPHWTLMRGARLCRGLELDELGAFLDELGRLVLDQLDAAAQQQLDAVQQAARPAARARELLPRLVGARAGARARARARARAGFRVRVRVRVRVGVRVGVGG